MFRKSMTASHTAGHSVFFGKLANSKDKLREQVEMITRLYSRDNGVIHVCQPAVAIGSGFSPNKHPRNRIVGVQSPLTV